MDYLALVLKFICLLVSATVFFLSKLSALLLNWQNRELHNSKLSQFQWLTYPFDILSEASAKRRILVIELGNITP